MNNSKLRLRFTGSCLRQEFANFIPNNVIIFFIVYILDRGSQDINAKFTLKDFLFETVKLTKDVDPNKYYYSGYGIGFHSY